MSTKTQQMPTTSEAPAFSSCYRKKQEASTMYENVVDRFDVFVHASVDEHKACFKNTIQKVHSLFNHHIFSTRISNHC